MMHEMLLGVRKDPRGALSEAIKTTQKAIYTGDDPSVVHGIMNLHPLCGWRFTDRRPKGPCPIHAIRNGMSIMQFSSPYMRLQDAPTMKISVAIKVMSG
jgi:hypothetical protein